MSRFLIGFILGVLLSNAHAIRAQEDVHQHDLSVKEVIEVLAEFDIRHIDQLPFVMPAYGVTTFESAPPTIYIFNVADMRSKKSTLIHEFMHAHCRNIGAECT